MLRRSEEGCEVAKRSPNDGKGFGEWAIEARLRLRLSNDISQVFKDVGTVLRYIEFVGGKYTSVGSWSRVGDKLEMETTMVRQRCMDDERSQSDTRGRTTREVVLDVLR